MSMKKEPLKKRPLNEGETEVEDEELNLIFALFYLPFGGIEMTRKNLYKIKISHSDKEICFLSHESQA